MPDPRKEKYTAALQFAEQQVLALAQRHPDFFPIYTVKGKWHHAGELWTDWTGGFLAGMMWQFFKRTGNADWGHLAEHYSRLLEHRQHDRNVHDLGFIFLSTYLPWYQLTGREDIHAVLVQAGRTLAMRFMEKGQYLRSFVAPESLFIDIMMNVPIIYYAAREVASVGNGLRAVPAFQQEMETSTALPERHRGRSLQNDADELRRIADAHCTITRDTIVREDGSTAHEGIFDLASGQFLRQTTHQGLRPNSAWARGLAWSMYGFSKCFGLTGNREWLAVAERNADYWITHLPKDHVPYWDFHADTSQPPPWGAQKDTSAGAIAASALLDLERQTESDDQARVYRGTALAMLDALVEPHYLAIDTPGWEGILKHGVYHTAKNLGVDESVMWGEYFYVEALTKVVTDTVTQWV
jgi:unsaturated chondroitin disaccharide hydrolase